MNRYKTALTEKPGYRFTTSRALVRLLQILCVAVCVHTGMAQTLTVSSGITSLTIHPGDSNVAIPVTVTAPASYSGAITVTLAGLPSGMSVTPATLSGSSSGTIFLSASVAADQENFPLVLYPSPPVTATSAVQMLAVAGTTQASAALQLTVALGNPAFTPTTVNLPVVQINTGGTAISSKTVDVPGTITITSADGSKTYLPSATATDNTATFHVHGNTTANMPKLPYNVKLTTGTDLLSDMGLTCPYVTGAGKPTCDKSKSYILLANYDDKTMLRDWAASALANAIPYGGNYLSPTPVPAPYTGTVPTPSGTKTPMPWAPHSLFVELYLNGAYQGTYQLIEQVKVDSHRLNIPSLAQTQVSGDLSGGYLLEIDQRQDEDFVFHTPQANLPVGLIDPDFSPEVPEQTSYIKNYVSTAENALFSTNFQDSTTGWRAYFDQASAVNYYIVNDLMGNVDGGNFYSSVYLYKTLDNPFLYMGPIWDFDISAGNVYYSDILSPTVPYTAVQAPWFARWFQDPSFKAATRQQWNALKNDGVLNAWLASIATQSTTLQQAQRNNFGRWPMLGIQVWPNAQATGTYTGEVNYLLAWLTLRMGYIDFFLNGTPSTTTSLTLSQSTAPFGSPVTLTAAVSGNKPTGQVIFTYNSVVLGQVPLSANGTASLTTSTIPAGTLQISAAYAGDSSNALSIAPTAALTILPAQSQTVTNLSTSASYAFLGAPFTLTAAVVGTQGTGTPTGSVTFSSNGTVLGTAQLASGIATLSTTSLPLGQFDVQARYTGDTNYVASVSNATPFQVLTGDFSLTAPSSATVLGAGATAKIPLSLTPLSTAFPGDVTLSLSGVPSTAQCTLSDTLVAANAGAQQVVLVCTNAVLTHATLTATPNSKGILFCGLLLLPLPWAGGSAKRRRQLLAAMVCAGVAIGLAGCGSRTSTATTSATIVVTATSAGLQHSATVSLALR